MNNDSSWEKHQQVLLWDETYDLRIVADAYLGELITEAQRESYLIFLDNVERFSKRSLELVAEYISKVYERVDANHVHTLMVPTAILFQQDGAFGILCDFKYDEEHGLAIMLYPKSQEQAGMQDIFI